MIAATREGGVGFPTLCTRNRARKRAGVRNAVSGFRVLRMAAPSLGRPQEVRSVPHSLRQLREGAAFGSENAIWSRCSHCIQAA